MTPGTHRPIALVAWCCSTIAGALLIWLAGRYRPAFETWVSADPRPRATITIAVMGVLTSGPLLGLAVYFWYRRLRPLAVLCASLAVGLAFALWRFVVLVLKPTHT